MRKLRKSLTEITRVETGANQETMLETNTEMIGTVETDMREEDITEGHQETDIIETLLEIDITEEDTEMIEEEDLETDMMIEENEKDLEKDMMIGESDPETDTMTEEKDLEKDMMTEEKDPETGVRKEDLEKDQEKTLETEDIYLVTEKMLM